MKTHAEAAERSSEPLEHEPHGPIRHEHPVDDRVRYGWRTQSAARRNVAPSPKFLRSRGRHSG